MSTNWKTYVNDNDIGELGRFPAEKKCSYCEEVKSVKQFSLYKPSEGKKRFWLSPYCKDCKKIKSRKYYEDNKDEARNKYYLRKYGITLDEYNSILEKQDGCCAICRSERPGSHYEFFSVDHCHETNEVRGLLCDHCNRGLGYFRDNPDLLFVAIDYLRKVNYV